MTSHFQRSKTAHSNQENRVPNALQPHNAPKSNREGSQAAQKEDSGLVRQTSQNGRVFGKDILNNITNNAPISLEASKASEPSKGP